MNKGSMLRQLQRANLQCQGLYKTATFGKGKQAVLQAIKHLGYIQIDTLAVVERANHHTLWTRIPDYKSNYLNQLVEKHLIFEYWFHAASYLPMNDYRYALPLMMHFKRGESRYYNNIDPKVLKYVHDKIRIEGPQKARDFKSSDKKSGKWWNWKPAKTALEKLFMQGDLMICERVGMEKVYDLTERVLPNNVNTTEPTPLEFAEYLVKTHLRAYGSTTIKQITHLKTGKSLNKDVDQVLQEMMEKQQIQQLKIEGLPATFVLSELLSNTIRKPAYQVRILSPFDNAIIHRNRVLQLYNFDFRLECYTPKEKRQYGYFCLPILFGDEFIGRVDCKVHRKEQELELISLHIEKKENEVDLWLKPLTKTFQEFATFNGCQSIRVTNVSPNGLTNLIKRTLSK